ncbi:uncharacterized protein LOC142804173 isoform X2 [Rhipicephalus microplus]|uniref:uncharacterized protein LOC142804173 isoform X2 n=1 Tax=Rhipicephalus microplus TaxID=6941 RepID=UPI003F6B0FE0
MAAQNQPQELCVFEEHWLVRGHSTLASSDPSASAGLATHALVFMLGGVMSRWKQAVAYHFSADFFDAKQVLAILIRKSEATGLSVDCNF